MIYAAIRDRISRAAFFATHGNPEGRAIVSEEPYNTEAEKLNAEARKMSRLSIAAWREEFKEQFDAAVQEALRDMLLNGTGVMSVHRYQGVAVSPEQFYAFAKVNGLETPKAD